jgi:quercetin dioxygenase-like cupin family protein
MKIVHREYAFEDNRGQILDILENEAIDSVTLINSKKGAIRGDHYHKETTQYVFILNGELELLTQFGEDALEKTVLKKGDLAVTDPMEKHTMKALQDSEFLVLTRGPRGGKNYENDTYKLEKSLYHE